MSPIIGLSEKRQLPRLGKIHLGVKVKNDKGVEYPKAVDYFVCPSEVQKVFGTNPKELRIMIPVEDEEKWASQYYRSYSMTRGLVCKGDGETCLRMVDIETGASPEKTTKQISMKEMKCEGRQCLDYQGKKCKEVMNLQFLLPEVPGLGIWQIDTGSINSIRNINSAAELIKRIYGHIQLIPLLLTLEPKPGKSPDGKLKTLYLLFLRVRETLGEMAKLANKSVLELTAGTLDEPDLPVADDEVPELIIPQNQRPEEPPQKVVRKPEPPKTTPEAKEAERLALRATIKNVGNFLKVCSERYNGMLPATAYLLLGVKSGAEIADAQEAFDTIWKAKEPKES